jgi:Fe-S cluster assembly protein SufD
LPEGLSVTRLADADCATQTWAAKRFACIKPERHLFGLVNDVLFSDGVIIDVAAGSNIEQPIRIVQQLSVGAEAHTRVLVRLGEDAKAAVIEQCDGSSESFNTLVAEYQISARAELEHYRFAFQVDKAMSVGGCHFDLAERAQLNSTLVGFGSTLSRVDVDIHHGGEHTFAKFNAIYLLDETELFDLHATVEHASPNGRTVENIRCIIADHAKAVFNGRIHIHRDAQKVLAELNNRNLLLSDYAEINTKPELEIYADDVKCAHGATIAAMDEQALYYLQSRGVDRNTAQVMLSFGFINELVDQMPNQILAEWLRPQLRQRFSKMEVS